MWVSVKTLLVFQVVPFFCNFFPISSICQSLLLSRLLFHFFFFLSLAMKMTMQQFNNSFCHQENKGMASEYIFYAPENRNGLNNYSYTSSSPSMGVFADMGSLSISPKNGVVLAGSSRDSCYSENFEKDDKSGGWTFPFMGSCTSSLEDPHNTEEGEGKGSDFSDGFGENNAAMEDNYNNNNLNEENPNVNGKEIDSGQLKLCARGHWRPAEDTKLKELVALYGPHNWNLIAEKLEGRSGKEKLIVFNSLFKKI